MPKKNSSRTGCIFLLVTFSLIIIASFLFYPEPGNKEKPSGKISWADAAEKCKAKYKAQRPAGVVKVPNCRKRTEDDDFFYFIWRKPLSIFIKHSKGSQKAYPGTCQVSRESGEIVYLTLNKRVLVNKLKK